MAFVFASPESDRSVDHPVGGAGKVAMDEQYQDEIARCAFRETNDALFVIETRGYRVMDLNPAALRLTGLTRKAALRLRLSDLFTAADPQIIERLFLACAKTGYFHSREDYCLNRLGVGFIPVNVSVSRIHTTREPLGLVVVRDVSDRRTAQDQLDRFFRLSTALFAILKPDGVFLRINPAWMQALGYTDEGLKSTTLFELAHPDDREAMRCAFDMKESAGLSDFEARFHHKSGAEHWFSWNVAVADGLLYAVANDITERKKSEALEQSKKAAEAANKAKGQFLAHMSHELRTPLTAILGLTDVLIMDAASLELPVDRLLDLQTIERNGNHLLSLINDILDFSKIEGNRLPIAFAPCHPAEVVADVIALMKGSANAKGLQLTVDYATPIPSSIATDVVRLRQILINLIGNAIKFTDQGSVAVRMSTVRKAGSQSKLRFDVIDTGVGMGEETVASLFQPFQQRTDASEKLQSGSGLGLVISRRLADLLGGTLEVRSKTGVGSTFSLAIAIGTLDATHLGELSNLREDISTIAPPPLSAPCRVLLAEDNADNRRAICMLLTHAGHQVSKASNGQEACDLATAALQAGEPFDVILMDMQMPIIDGFQATRMLRASGYTKPILALTAYAMAEDREECLQAGCTDHLSKPIDWNQLNRFLASVVGFALTPVVE